MRMQLEGIGNMNAKQSDFTKTNLDQQTSVYCQDFTWPQSCKLSATQGQPLCLLNIKEIF